MRPRHPARAASKPDHLRRAPPASLVGELLESALNSYQGTFMVVSHDERFLSAIGVNRRLRLLDEPTDHLSSRLCDALESAGGQGPVRSFSRATTAACRARRRPRLP
ncbi:hypothetical protein [Streptomyces sp. NPDC017988]|uniref:hypothetical protein n=1 Tax=Streptomyces sp. NPDC017988 TaxID=3365025 RepID=UPI0037931A34